MKKIKNFLNENTSITRGDCLGMMIGSIILLGYGFYCSRKLDQEVDENEKLFLENHELWMENNTLKENLKDHMKQEKNND